MSGDFTEKEVLMMLNILIIGIENDGILEKTIGLLS